MVLALVTVLLAAPIVDGTAVTGDPAVVAIGVRRLGCGERLTAHCTGTLIAPRLVLTAAHCVSDPRLGGGLEVLFGSDVAATDARVVGVTEAVIHPDHRGAGDDADLALLVLDREAGAPAVAMGDPPLDALVGAAVRIVGFGLDSLAGGVTGTKRVGTSIVVEVEARTFRTEPGPALTCQGDSGGPVFADTASGERLVGVAVSGDPGCASHGTNVRVDAHLTDFIGPWIEATAQSPAQESPTGAQLDEALCAGICTDSSQCPHGLSCLPGQEEGGAPISRCTLPGLLPGTFNEVCAPDVACAGTCVRLLADDTPESCRCYEPCEPPPQQQQHGCRLMSPSSPDPNFAALTLLAILSALVGLRRRA